MAQKKMDKNPSKNISKINTPNNAELTLQIGSQYLCQSSFNAPQLPQILREITSPPHLHLVVDASLQYVSEEEQAYEVRLNLQGYGLKHIPKKGEELTPLYNATIIYGGLFAVIGEGTKEALEQFVLNEAPHYLYPTVRTMLLNSIKEAGFNVGNMQPINFKLLWEQRRANQATQ